MSHEVLMNPSFVFLWDRWFHAGQLQSYISIGGRLKAKGHVAPPLKNTS